MSWFDRHDNRETEAPRWARVLSRQLNVIVMQNEIILAKLEQRNSKLSPEDQAKVDEIFAIEQSDAVPAPAPQ